MAAAERFITDGIKFKHVDYKDVPCPMCKGKNSGVAIELLLTYQNKPAPEDGVDLARLSGNNLMHIAVMHSDVKLTRSLYDQLVYCDTPKLQGELAHCLLQRCLMQPFVQSTAVVATNYAQQPKRERDVRAHT